MKAALATIFGCFLGGIAALVLALFLIESFGGGLLDFFSGSDTYVEGSAYGFTIGSTKEETFRDLWEFNEDSPVTFFQRDIPGSLHIFEFNDMAAEEILMKTDLWYFHPDDGYAVQFELSFRDGKLIKIYRFWAYLAV